MINTYIPLSVIGIGSYGRVYSAIDSKNKMVAMKIVNSKNADMTNEYNILFKLKHNNIITVYDFYKLDNLQFLVLEYSQQGDLLNYLNKNGGLGEAFCKKLFKQLVDAIAYMHNNYYIHLDIKPDNILLFDNDIKLTDFGFADSYDPNQVKLRTKGSEVYGAPELARRIETIGPELDIWSIGITLFCSFYGRVPFPYNKKDGALATLAVFEKLGLHFSNNKKVDKDFVDLVSAMLVFDHKKRFTIKQVRDSPWFNDKLHLNLTKITTGDQAKTNNISLSPE